MEAIKDSLIEWGYFDIKDTGEQIIALSPFVFTIAIVCGIDEIGYSHRYCYPDLGSAKGALKDWENNNFKGEPVGYIVRK